jgi:hypothetical protein
MQENIHTQGLQAESFNPDDMARLHDLARQQAEHLRREAMAQWPASSLGFLSRAMRRLANW